MRLTMNMFLSLDGVLQSPGMPDEDPRGGFRHGGWQVPYFDDELMRLVGGWFKAADGFLLGRRTYEIFASYWPKVTGDELIANPLNSKPKYLVSTTLTNADWEPTTILSGDIPQQVAELKRQPGNELQVHGSGRLAQTLMAHDLIDEYRLWIYPVVLGAGQRLFPDRGPAAALTLVDTHTTSTGGVLHVYHPAGKPTYGSTALDQ
jgi:dihydrofolate reductase